MRPVVITLTGTGSTLNSAPIPVSWRANPTSISLFFDTGGNTTGFTVQYSGDDPNASYATSYNVDAKWFNHAFMAAMTADLSGNIAYPVRAIRLQADTNGTDTGTLTIIQSGVGD